MMHLDDGQLRAYLDHETVDTARAEIEQHLAVCVDCRARANEFGARSNGIVARLNMLEASTTLIAPAVALARFKNRRLGKEIPMIRKIFSPRYRWAWGTFAVIALLAVAMTFAPVRAWAEGLLAQFRVERVQVLPIDPTRLTELGSNQMLAQQISQMIGDSSNVTKEPISPQVVANASEASTLAGFAVRLPANRSDAPRITAQGGAAFEFKVNRQRAQALLDQTGNSNLQLPAALDGALIKVNIPVGITAAYGNCPKLDKDTSGASRSMLGCLILTEIPSPTIDAPSDLNVQQLAEIGLRFIGMPQAQARELARTVDWTSTLVVPIPRNSATAKQVQVDGVTGYLIQRSPEASPEYVLIWVKGGIVYAIAGVGTDTAPALTMGNSLK